MKSEYNPADGIAFANGDYMPLAQASIPITDRGFVRSDATYDVAHVWKGRFFRLDDHIERFQESMRGLRMNLPYSSKEIARDSHRMRSAHRIAGCLCPDDLHTGRAAARNT